MFSLIRPPQTAASKQPLVATERRARRRFACLSLLLMMSLQVASTAAGQRQTPDKSGSQDQVVRLKTDLVEIRAVVSEKQGKAITGLSKDDFEIIENGHKQVVSFFSAENLKADAQPAVTPRLPPGNQPLPNRSAPAATPPRRTVVFLVDALNMAPSSLLRVKEMLLKFIDDRMGSEDLAAIVSTNGGLGLFGQFTIDKQVLRVAVNRLQPSPALRSGSLFTPYLAARVQQERVTQVPPGRTLAEQMSQLPAALQTAMNIVKAEENLPEGFSIILDRTLDLARQTLFAATYQRRVAMLTLKAVAAQLATLPGQRLIFMLSDGFTMSDDSGTDDSGDLQAAVSGAARHGVVVYTLAAKGLTGPSLYDAASAGRFSPNLPGVNNIAPLSMASDRDLEHGLQRIAAGTGGQAFLTTNDLSGAIEKAMEANSFYYALSYYPANLDTSNGFRSIKIKIRNHPEYIVRTQSGYLASELNRSPAAVTDPMKALINAMGEPLPKTDLPVEIAADFLYLPTDKAQVSLNIYIAGSKLGYQEQDNSFLTSPTLLIGVIDSVGNNKGIWQDTIQIRLSREQLANARQSMYHYTKRLILMPGVYQVRVGVRDPQTEQIGTAAAWVEVPDLRSKQLILSSLRTAKQQRAEAENNAASGVAPPDVRNGMNVFRRLDAVIYRGWAYQPGLGAASAEAVMLQEQVLQDGRIVWQSDWRPLSSLILSKEQDGVEFGGQLNVADFKPGLYMLRILVKERPSKAPLQKETLFGIMP